MASRSGLRKCPRVLATIMMLVAGLMFVRRANDLVFLFVGLELISIPTYVLLFLGRQGSGDGRSDGEVLLPEHLRVGPVAVRIQFLYGVGGVTTLSRATHAPGIREAVAQLPADQMTLSGVPGAGLCRVGLQDRGGSLSFLCSGRVPGHDQRQRRPAGRGAENRRHRGPDSADRATTPVRWRLAMVRLAMLTMTLGNVCALWQQNIRRLMAYSSIAHAGYMLIGLAVSLAKPESGYGGVAAMLLYLLVYVLAALGTFAALTTSAATSAKSTRWTSCGAGSSSSAHGAGAMAVFMFSLAGIPPLAGFWGKLALFSGAVQLAISDTGGVSSRFCCWRLWPR